MMHTGMLWFDNSSKTLAEKIQRGADYYEKKYGRSPDLCLVNPAELVGNVHLSLQASISVRPYRFVLPGHIWIGLEDKS